MTNKTITAKSDQLTQKKLTRRLYRVVCIAGFVLTAFAVLYFGYQRSPYLASRLLAYGWHDREEWIVDLTMDRKRTIDMVVADLIQAAEGQKPKVTAQDQVLRNILLKGIALGSPAILQGLMTNYFMGNSASISEVIPQLAPIGAALGFDGGRVLRLASLLGSARPGFSETFETSGNRSVHTITLDASKNQKVVLLWERKNGVLWKLIGILNLSSLLK